MSGTVHSGLCTTSDASIRPLTSVKLSPGDDLIMSTMYSLLNFIAVTSKELTGQGTAPRGEKAKVEAKDDMHIAFGTFTDNEKRILGISTICVVTHLALEVKKEEVC
jgi:phosphatidylinositol 4-kinase A